MDANRRREHPGRISSLPNPGSDLSRRRYHFVCGTSTCAILHHSEQAARSDLGWLFPRLDIGPCIRIEHMLPEKVPGTIADTSF